MQGGVVLQINWLDICFDMIDGYIPEAVENYSEGLVVRNTFLRMADHAAEVISHNILSNPDITQKERIVYLLIRLGIGYRAAGNYTRALDWKLKSVDYAEKHFDDGHHLVATTYVIVATEYSEHEKNTLAYDFYNKVLKILDDTYGYEHIDKARVYNGIANIHLVGAS
jgi:tetratricopeptide (TPR) repeat protein